MFKKRIEKLLETMESDHYLLYTPESIYYFTGFKPHLNVSFALIGKDGQRIIMTDGRYAEQARMEAKDSFFKVCVTEPGEGILDILIKILRNKVERIFCSVRLHIEQHPECLFPARYYIELKQAFPYGVIDFPRRKVLDIRAIKEPGEITAVKNAVRISQKVLAEMYNFIEPGILETQIAAEISYRHQKYGASGDSFSPIVASGVNSVLPHAQPKKKAIEPGDLVQFDMGCVFDGYCSDISRVIFMGRPTARQKQIYKTVLSIQKKMVSLVKPGISFSKLNEKHFELIKKAGFRPEHGLGHGVGLNVHEYPCATTLPSNFDGDFIAEPGHIITIEPGIYIPGEFGVRIEDMVLVTEKGHEILTKMSKDINFIPY